MHKRNSDFRQLVVPILAWCVFLSLTSRVFADSGAEPDVPAATAAPVPRSMEQEIKLANDYLIGRGVAQDPKQAAYWFEEAAGAGNAQAQMQIGYFYDSGIGVARDPERAAHWYQLAAAGGLAEAKTKLGVLYLWGNGVKKNEQFAERLFREAAAKGSGSAACFLGDIYYLGGGGPQDKLAGEKWYEKGAAMHNPQAEYDLGLLFFTFKDHVHDAGRAASLLRQSAAAGYVPAIHSLGLLLVRNPSLEQSPDEAVTLLNDAANAGMWKSSIVLGALARDGKGVPRDAGAAYFHFRVAALQGGDDAKPIVETDLRRLSSELGPGQTASLDSQAEDWYHQRHAVLQFVSREGKNRTMFPYYSLAVPEKGTHAAQILPALPD